MAKRTATTSSADNKSAGYTVLARRFRSRDFAELIGQEPIARTLQNAIKTNRIAHAYLFCGTRGVGKTSMARIFAKALNATDDLSQQDEIADAILRGEDLDVIEIDGASYRGIDAARDLIANAGLHPTRSPYKIYIIDEVHQLTKDAFNALLKTMEEPPVHVKFILCTTEPHKVPQTIQSRCQRFDFRAIPSSKIAEQLRKVLEAEGVKAEEEAVAQVARLGNGSMRDALSLLDRLLAGGDRKLTMQLVEEMLGLPDHTLVSELVDGIIAADAKAALDHGAQLLARGATVEQALEMLAEHLRNLMVIAACGADNELLDMSDENRKTAARQASHFDAQALVHMIAVCDAVSRNARNSSTSRAMFDAAIVRLCMSEHLADISKLLSGTAPPNVPQPGRYATLGESKPLPDSKKKDSPLDEIAHSRENQQRAPSDVQTEVKPVAGHLDPHTEGEQLWSRTVERAATGSSPADRVRIEHLRYQSFEDGALKLSIDEGGADIVRILQAQADRLEDQIKRATGRKVRVVLDAGELVPAPPKVGTSAEKDAAPRPPVVDKAVDLFDATIISVEETTSGPSCPGKAGG